MINFIRQYPALLLFGILTAAFSSPGQTFLVSLFIPHLQTAFDLTKTEIAAYYSMATFVSAFLLPWEGRLLDRLHLKWFTVAAAALLSLGCFILSGSTGLAGFLIGILLVRNLGQGVLGMISSTTMARIFGHLRGKALGIANVGYPLGEAVFPIVLSSWIIAFGWRSGWLFLGALTFLFLLPAVFFLLGRDRHKHVQESILRTKGMEDCAAKVKQGVRDWPLNEVLRDMRFYLLLASGVVAPFLFTGLFFHQVSFAQWKGWDLRVLASGFIAFGVCRAAVSFLIGPVVDRWGAKKLYPLSLVPLAIGLICFLSGGAAFWTFFYLGFAGMTMGISMTVSGALFAECYGIAELGAIRGIKSALVVFCTAISPVAVGALLDAAVPAGWIIAGMLILTFSGIVLAALACNYRSSADPAPKLVS